MVNIIVMVNSRTHARSKKIASEKQSDEKNS